jgi:hypothetical protein
VKVAPWRASSSSGTLSLMMFSTQPFSTEEKRW